MKRFLLLALFGIGLLVLNTNQAAAQCQNQTCAWVDATGCFGCTLAQGWACSAKAEACPKTCSQTKCQSGGGGGGVGDCDPFWDGSCGCDSSVVGPWNCIIQGPVTLNDSDHSLVPLIRQQVKTCSSALPVPNKLLFSI